MAENLWQHAPGLDPPRAGP